MSEELVIDGVRFQADDDPDAIYCGPLNQVEANDLGIELDDVIRATIRFLTEEEGFSSDSFEITTGERKNSRLIKVKFINDGITMAKIRGIIGYGE